MASREKRAIAERYICRADAERYRDRFRTGRRTRTHEREGAALDKLLSVIGRVDTILDVGSGPGRFTTHFVRFADRVIEMDYSMHMLTVSRDDHSLYAPRIDYVRADAMLIPLADESVDVVFCHRLLNHVPQSDDRVMILHHFARVARKYVVVSCLSPPTPVRLVRRLAMCVTSHCSLDGHVDSTRVLWEAAIAGLRVWRQERIRSFPAKGEFYILERASCRFHHVGFVQTDDKAQECNGVPFAEHRQGHALSA